ncbi:TPA: LPD7 domain-containing protein [Pseudomonas aeruginosa]
MIIRYGGGNDGIKDYLENGRKVDRHFSRDELDRRIPIEGDLNVTQAVIDSIDDHGQERYLHITMSFHEPDITEEKMVEVFQQYKRELMTAYGDDEFNIYAEIHWPKIKEAYNHQTEQMEPRFPHVHVVLPKRNLLTGGFLDPCSMQQRSVKYFDAIQEKLNRDNGLSSPRNSPRVGTNHYEAALGKYKDKEFRTKNGELKRDIFNAMLDRDVRTVSEFKALISEFGEVRARNEGKDNEYFAIRVSGDKKFTNLKANIFDKQFIENRALTLEPVTDAQVARRLDTWRNIQSKEIKFISNASAKVKETYKSLSLPERRQFLADRESYYEQRYREQPAGGKESHRPAKTKLPGLREGNYKSSHLEFARGLQAEGARHLHELRTSNVDHFRPEEDAADRLLLQGDADDDLQHLQSHGGIGLRRDLYAGGGQGGLIDSTDPQSSVLASLIEAEREKERQQADLQRFAEIRKNLDPQHLLAFAQIRFGVDPDKHPVSTARDGSPRIRAGKLNLNVSDFLTKHIGLEWAEASQVLVDLYEKQQRGIVDKPKSKVAHIDDWRRFRDEVYPKNIRTYEELKNQIKVSYSLGMKSINAEYFARRKSITNDSSLGRTDKHYFRSVVILEKLQKVESLQHRIKEQNSLTDRVKYPYSTLFYDFATKNEEISMKVLEQLKRRYLHPAQESENTIGAQGLQTPHHMPSGAEAAKRARLIAKLHNQERELKELKIRVSDLRPKPLPSGAVAFTHKDHGKQIFVNHPDRLEMNRVTDHDEVAVGMIYAVERFGSPLDIKGTPEFKEQIIAVAAERDMDITFTDEALNQALQAKRLELGMEPLQANEIGVQELELDTSLPLDQAADKALLDSKVAELEQINQAHVETPADSAELELREAMLAEALQRHEEVEAGFVDDARVEEIAKADVEAWAYLEGKPQQQHLALSMATALQNHAYSGYMEKNGPQELQLTIDATKVVQGREAERAAQQSATEQHVVPDAQEVALAPVPESWRGPACQIFDEEIGARMGDPSYSRAQELASKLATFEEMSFEPSESERALLAENKQGIEETRQWIKDNVLLNPLVKERMYETVRDLGRETGDPVADKERQDYLAEMETTLAEAKPEPAAPAMPDFTHNGAPATVDLSRFQQQPEAPTVERLQAEVEGYDRAEQEARAQVAELERQREEEGMFLSEDDANALDERIAETRGQADGLAEAKARSEQELYTAAPELRPTAPQPEPLQFTHNGEPATLDLSRFQQQPEQEQDTPADAERAAPEPLQFTNNGAPATVDLSRFQQQPEAPTVERLQAEVDGYGHAEQEARAQVAELERQREEEGMFLSEDDANALDERIAEARDQADGLAQAKARSEQELYTAAPELRPTAPQPEPLQFTHNGEPATLDLSRFQQQEADSRLVNPALEVAPSSAGLQTGEQSPEVEAKVAELQQMQEQANDPDTYSEIYRYAEAVHRLENIEEGMSRDSAADRLARSHLMAFTDYEGTPYEQAMAEVIVDGMESNDRYRTTIEEECPESMEVTLRAAQVGRDRAISLKDTAKDFDAQVMGSVNFGALSVDDMRSHADFDVLSLSGDPKRDGHVLAVMQERMQYQPYREAVATSAQSLQQAQHPAADAIAERCDVLAKAADFEAINRQYQGRDAYDDPSSIVRRGVMVEMEVRHSSLQIDKASPEAIREVARQDLELFGYLDGKPEQQRVALAMGGLMENEHYNAYMVNNAPQDFGVTIEAAQVVSESQQSMASVEHERDNSDMEI